MNIHGIVDRPTQDLDCFAVDVGEVERFSEPAIAALTDAGYRVNVVLRQAGFVRLMVTEERTGEGVGVDLASDYRLAEPVQTSVGPVLAVDDLAADKTLAVFGRWEPRDFVDLHALLDRYSPERLLELAAAKDLGFSARYFAEALARVHELPSATFGLERDDYDRLVERMDRWRRDILALQHQQPGGPEELLRRWERDPPGGTAGPEPPRPEPG